MVVQVHAKVSGERLGIVSECRNYRTDVVFIDCVNA